MRLGVDYDEQLLSFVLLPFVVLGVLPFVAQGARPGELRRCVAMPRVYPPLFRLPP